MADIVITPAAAAEAALRVRKERIHTTMLIELLALLVFMSMAFAFVTRDETAANSLLHRIELLEGQLRNAKQEIHKLKVENQNLKRENAELQESLRRLANMQNEPLPADDRPVPIPKRQWDQILADLSNTRAMLEERQKENAELRRRLAQSRGGGTDLPNCTVTAGRLITVDLLADGRFRAAPAWAAGSEAAVARVPGVEALAAGRVMSAAEFLNLSSRVAGWGLQQPTPCGFRAEVKEQHSNLQLYKKQLQTVERYFYVRRR